MSFRECGDCTACCDGFLLGNSHGNRFGNKKSCIFLVHKKCSIYADRPQSCHYYQCAWTQGILPEWMKPNKCGVLVSVETQPDKQYLKVIEMCEIIEHSVYAELEQFCTENNTYYIRVPYEKS